MKLIIAFIALFSVTYAVNPSTTVGFVSENFAQAEIQAEEKSENEETNVRKDGAERRNIKVKGKETGFKVKPFVATGLFICSAITGYLGYDANEDAKFYHKQYESSFDDKEVEKYRKLVSESESSRNLYYGISGSTLLGVVVTLTLF